LTPTPTEDGFESADDGGGSEANTADLLRNRLDAALEDVDQLRSDASAAATAATLHAHESARELEAAEAKLEALAEAAAVAAAEKAALAEEAAALQRQVASLEADRAELAAQLGRGASWTGAEQQPLEARLKLAEQDKAVAVEGSTAAAAAASRAAAELEAARASVAELKTKNASFKSRFKSMSGEWTSKYNFLKERCEQVEELLAASNSSNKQLQAELVTARGELATTTAASALPPRQVAASQPTPSDQHRADLEASAVLERVRHELRASKSSKVVLEDTLQKVRFEGLKLESQLATAVSQYEEESKLRLQLSQDSRELADQLAELQKRGPTQVSSGAETVVRAPHDKFPHPLVGTSASPQKRGSSERATDKALREALRKVADLEAKLRHLEMAHKLQAEAHHHSAATSSALALRGGGSGGNGSGGGVSVAHTPHRDVVGGSGSSSTIRQLRDSPALHTPNFRSPSGQFFRTPASASASARRSRLGLSGVGVAGVALSPIRMELRTPLAGGRSGTVLDKAAEERRLSFMVDMCSAWKAFELR
jgi:hypothetical protein